MLRVPALVFATILAAGPVLAQVPWLRLPPTPALPAPERVAYVPVAGARIWCAEYGRGHADTVVLVHGGLANSAYWGGLIPDLARDYHVILLDSRGHGRSSLGTAAIGYERMADDTLAVMDHFGVARAALVGWSDGGIVGLEIAWHHPDRLTRLFAFAANSDISGTHDPAAGEHVFADYVARARGEYARLSPTPGGFAAFDRAVEGMWAREPHMSADDLGGIGVPTWIVDADHDEVIYRANTDFMAAHIPAAREMILPGVSHFAFLQDPVMFGFAVRRFLAERD